MAEGSGTARADLFRLNLTELGAYAEKCTDVALPVSGRGGKGILLAHNEDWNPQRNDVFVLKAKLPGASYLTLAYNGYLPGLSAGLNSFGLCHSVNYLHSKDRRPGLPRIFVTRHLVTAPSPRECLRFIREAPRAFGQAIHLAQGRSYWSLELSSRSWVRRRPSLPSAHTNHYLAPRLTALEAQISGSSRVRLATARKLLRQLAGRVDARRIAELVLSDRSGFPHAIWRQADHPDEPSATLAAVFLRSDLLTMEVFRGAPTRVRPLKFKL